MIHGPYSIKLITAQQAMMIHTYENVKMKLYKCIAAIWYNKTCKRPEASNSTCITTYQSAHTALKDAREDGPMRDETL
jgi:hypothetical protein